MIEQLAEALSVTEAVYLIQDEVCARDVLENLRVSKVPPRHTVVRAELGSALCYHTTVL